MFSEQNEQVYVRYLGDGGTQEGVCESLEGSQLYVRFLAQPPADSFLAGQLVEVNAHRTLYLGEITSRHDDLVLIAVEHALNRETLAAIQEVWHRPNGL